MKNNNWIWIILIIIGAYFLISNPFSDIDTSGNIKLAATSSRIFDKSTVLKTSIVTVTYSAPIAGWTLKMKLPQGWTFQEALPMSNDGYYREYIPGTSNTYHLIPSQIDGTYSFNQDQYCVPEIISGQRIPCSWATYPNVNIQVISCAPITEVCDGKDNDCDNQIDETLGSTTCGLGPCQKTVQNCLNGVTQTCTPLASSTETCNNVDDDCNGAIDNGLTQSQNCGSNVGYCQYGTQTKSCSTGTWGNFGTCTGGRIAITEICGNGIDEDCNGIDLSGNTPADTNCNGCVSDEEFPIALTNWKNLAGGITDDVFPLSLTKWQNREGC